MKEVITDNSKVNENLLKENEELKEKLDQIEGFCITRQSLNCVSVLNEFFIDKVKLKVTQLLSGLSEEEKQELKRQLK